MLKILDTRSMPNVYGYFCRDGHNVCAINADIVQINHFPELQFRINQGTDLGNPDCIEIGV